MMPIEPDHYKVLELEPGSPMEDVKSQYRRLAKRCHPDLHNNDAKSQEWFRRINAAYAFLSDAPRKAAYDERLKAARKMAASSTSAPKPAPPAASRTSPTATGYHVPVTATGYHARTAADVRMTQSAWLGATAGAVLVLLVIGLSLDGSGPSRPVNVEVTSPAAPESPSGSALGDGLQPGVNLGPAADPLASSSPNPPFAVPEADASPPPPARIAPRISYTPTPVPTGMTAHAGVIPFFRAGNTGVPPRAEEANLTAALKQRLQARYQAALPRTDRLINRGYAVRASSPDAENESRQLLRDQLAADLAALSATRARLQPAISRLSRQDTHEKLQQQTRPILADLRRLEDARQPVRDDIRALSAGSIEFRFAPAAPARTASVVPGTPASTAPFNPAPSVTPPGPEAPKPLDKPTDKPASKPKAPAASGQEFIMWDK